MFSTSSIGRIGALAVALGIGYGVNPAVALADTGDSGSADSASASSATPARQARPSGATAARGRSAHPNSDSASAAQQTPDVQELLPAVEAAPVAQRGSHAAATSAPPVSKNSAPAATAMIAPTLAASIASAPAAAEATLAPSAGAEPAVAVPVRSAADAAPTAAVTATTRAAAAAAVAQVGGDTAPAVPLPAATTAQLVSAALAPLLGGTGGAPAQAPLLWTVMSWARREFDRLIGATKLAAVTTTGQTQSPNLLVNPGAEFGDPSPSSVSTVTIPGWTVTGSPTVIKYGTTHMMWSDLNWKLPSIWSFPTVQNGATNGGNQFFGGGLVADSAMSQTVDLSEAGAAIDGGNLSYNLGAWLGGYSFDPSKASVKVTFLDAGGKSLGTGKIGPVTMWDRLFAINLLQRSATGTLPVGTRSATVDVEFKDLNPVKYGFNADYNDAFADNISFTIGADLPAPPAPTPIASAPPALDHVFMVWEENKSYNDIIGSSNAPYINSLIKTYGFADNFYGLTHPSHPNYIPMVGATDYGFAYNCTGACIDVAKSDTLPGRLDQAGKTWKAYTLGLAPGGDPLVATGNYSPDQTVFPTFQWFANDPAYARAHILPLEQIAVDLKSKDTTPNYVWFGANEAYNGEGPLNDFSGKLKFVLNQLDPKHQYNVPALDTFLSQTVPTILSSPVWNDPTQKSVLVVSFDEDSGVINLGFGNDGNHVVTVVIPSAGAIAAGMKGGSFTATGQYNHYSLLRFIEDSLGVAPINNNDKYATPMNEFWTGTAAAT